MLPRQPRVGGTGHPFLRKSIDGCDLKNGPIRFIPGSHRGGVLNPHEIEEWTSKHEAISCPAKQGDVILMRPLALHSSSKSEQPTGRRVLHLEYANASLPGGLGWVEA